MSPSTEAIILIIGVLYLGLSLAMQRKLVNVHRMRELRMKMGDLQKELNAMIKSKAPQEAITAKNKELMPIAGEQMRSSLKPMLIIPIFLILYYYALPLEFGSVAVVVNGATYQAPYAIAVNSSAVYSYSFQSSAAGYTFVNSTNGCTGISGVGASGTINGSKITGNCTIEGFYNVNGVGFGTSINDNQVSKDIALNVSYSGTNYSYLNNQLPISFGSASGSIRYSYARSINTSGGSYNFSHVEGCGYNSSNSAGVLNFTDTKTPCLVTGYYTAEPAAGAQQAGSSTHYVTFIGNLGKTTGTALILMPLNYQSLFFYPVLVLGLIASLVIMKYDSNKIKQMRIAKEIGQDK